MSAGPDVACTASGTGCLCFVLVLRWSGLLITSDWVFLLGEIFFLRCKRVVSIYHCCFGLFHLVFDFWSDEVFAK
jgi:hypothetical protein